MLELVEEKNRLSFLPRHLPRHFMEFEQLVYHFASKFSDYDGGYWEFYENENGVFMMQPRDEQHNVHFENYFSVDVMPARTFGLIMCLYALGELANRTLSEPVLDKYWALREWAAEHGDKVMIWQALD